MNITFILGITLFISICFILYVLYSLRSIQKQITHLSHENTNNVVKSPSQNPFIVELVQSVNHLLIKSKKSEVSIKEKNQQIDQALNNIAHDLRTPLTVALGYCQYLKENPSLDQTEYQEILESIDKNLDLVYQRLEMLLDYNRINESTIKLLPEYFNLSELLTETLLTAYPSFTTKQFKVSLNIEPLIFVILDRNQTLRIIQNIIGNILEHGCKTAEFKLECSTKHQCILSVKNEMTKPIKSVERLTERFYTEDFSRQKEASGLGLHIIKHLTEMQSGKLNLNVTDTLFEITLTFPMRSL